MNMLQKAQWCMQVSSPSCPYNINNLITSASNKQLKVYPKQVKLVKKHILLLRSTFYPSKWQKYIVINDKKAKNIHLTKHDVLKAHDKGRLTIRPLVASLHVPT